jgi:hypothetical protein
VAQVLELVLVLVLVLVLLLELLLVLALLLALVLLLGPFLCSRMTPSVVILMVYGVFFVVLALVECCWMAMQTCEALLKGCGWGADGSQGRAESGGRC